MVLLGAWACHIFSIVVQFYSSFAQKSFFIGIGKTGSLNQGISLCLNLRRGRGRVHLKLLHKHCLYFQTASQSISKMKTSLLFLSILVKVLGQINYVQNGGFQDPFLTVRYEVNASIPFWSGYFDLFKAGTLLEITYSQIIDLASYSNGFIEQIVSLPEDGNYSLSFFAKDRAANLNVFNESAADVYWNEVKVLACHPLPMQNVTQLIYITGKAGLNHLKFVEVGSNNSIGLLVDNVTIHLIPKIENSPFSQSFLSTSQQEKNKIFRRILATISIVPLNQLKLAYICFFIEDISLYIYVNRSYSPKVSDIFNFINKVQMAKWSFLINLNNEIKDLKLPVSNYSLFSSRKHLEIDEKDDSLIQNTYLFLIFSIPQTVVLVTLLKLIFHCLENYKLSVFFRRFSFFSCAVFQTIFEGSISYLTYLSFNQLQILFAFTIVDKLFLGFAVAFFWICLMHAVCFYFLANYLHSKKAGYFIYCYYRSLPGLSFVTARVGLRSIVRGIIFSVLQQQYSTQCLLLIFVELTLIVTQILLQLKYEIFIYESKFCLQILHHSLLAAMTAFLLIEKRMEIEIDASLKLLIESSVLICIYSMGAVAVLDFAIQLFSQRRVYSEQFLQLDRVSSENYKQQLKIESSAHS